MPLLLWHILSKLAYVVGKAWPQGIAISVGAGHKGVAMAPSEALFFFLWRATPLVLEPAVIAYPITVDSESMGIETGGDGIWELVVMAPIVVVMVLFI